MDNKQFKKQFGKMYKKASKKGGMDHKGVQMEMFIYILLGLIALSFGGFN